MLRSLEQFRSRNREPTSVGVVVHTEPMGFGSGANILLVEHADQLGVPIGIPAGHVETGESPCESAIRELREETGLEVKNSELQVLTIIPHWRKPKMVYSCQTDLSKIWALGNWHYSLALTRRAEHPYWWLQRNTGEIGNLFLLSWVYLLAFEEFSEPFLPSRLYRPKIAKHIARELRSLVK